MNRRPSSSESPLGLWAQAFIDGFSKPSYVMIVAELDGRLGAEKLRAAARALVARHPALRSRLRRRLLPRLVADPTARWEASGIVVGEVDVQHELARHVDLEHEHAFRVWLTHDGTRVVARVHHALVDAHAGRLLITELAALCAGRALPPMDPAPATSLHQRLFQATRWLRGIERRPRVPEVSLVADFTPARPLRELGVATVERRVARSEHKRLRALAGARRCTFSELLFASLLLAMHRYNRARRERLPPALGLMIAQSRRRERHSQRSPRGFVADTRVLAAGLPLLASGDRDVLMESVRVQMKRGHGRHNDLGIALLLLERRAEALFGKPSPAERVPPPVTALHFVASDLTATATRLSALDLGDCKVERLRYLVSPVAAEHGGLLAYLDRDELCFSVVSHHGALDADDLLDELFSVLDVAPKGTARERNIRSLSV